MIGKDFFALVTFEQRSKQVTSEVGTKELRMEKETDHIGQGTDQILALESQKSLRGLEQGNDKV